MKTAQTHHRLYFVLVFVLMMIAVNGTRALGDELKSGDAVREEFLRGRELMQDGQRAEGLECYRRAATNGLLRAQVTLVELLRTTGSAADRSEALRWAAQGARQSDSYCRNYLAQESRLEDSTRVVPFAPESPDTALYPARQYAAGRRSYLGEGEPKNYARAYECFSEVNRHETFRREYPDVIYLLGYLSENGFGVLQNYTAAAAFYEQAAERGSPRAVYRLGQLLENGQGVARNPAAARTLFEKAAGLGMAEAAYRLGLLANDWRPETHARFLQAATNGLSMAQMKVAASYEHDWFKQGTNVVEALAWYQIAAAGGNRGGRLKAENLNRLLTAEQQPKLAARLDALRSLIRETSATNRPGVNLLPENFSRLRNENSDSLGGPTRNKPRRLTDARLQTGGESDTARPTRRNDLDSGTMKIYLADLNDSVRDRVNERLKTASQRDHLQTRPIPPEMEIILSYRLKSDGRVEDVTVIDTNLPEGTAMMFVFALEDLSPTPRWTPGLRAELTEEYQDLLLAFGKKSILRISQ